MQYFTIYSYKIAQRKAQSVLDRPEIVSDKIYLFFITELIHLEN